MASARQTCCHHFTSAKASNLGFEFPMAKSVLGFCLNLRNFIHPLSNYFSTIFRIHCYNRDLAVAPHSRESTSANVPQTCFFRSRPFPDLLQRRAKLQDKPLCGVLALNVVVSFFLFLTSHLLESSPSHCSPFSSSIHSLARSEWTSLSSHSWRVSCQKSHIVAFHTCS